jgi:arylamine N-acetyltransferase
MTEWATRYLNLLGLDRPESHSLDWLRRFGGAHLRAVPFCNVTAIQRRMASRGEGVPPLEREALLHAWEQRTGGGVCFEVAEMVWTLLRKLGYEAHVVLGQITFPGSHQAVVVRLREGPYMADLGCGAPLPDPIPLIRDTEYHVAALGYRFRPDLASMTCAQDRLIDGEWTEFCRYDLRPASDEERHAGYQRHHDPGESWVVGGVTLMRYFDAEGEVVALRDGRFTRYRAGEKHSAPVAADAEYERHVRDDLRWPELPIDEALRALRMLRSSEPTGQTPT